MKNQRAQRRTGTDSKRPAQPQAGPGAVAPESGVKSPPPESTAPGPQAPASGASLVLKWFFNGTLRQGLQMRRHVWKLVQHQRDLLSAEALQGLQQSMDVLRARCASGDRSAIQAGMDDLEQTANKHLKSYLFPSVRENIEVLLVAIAVAMTIRTFFLQPFKIPTGSMQPTLWGITSNPDCMHDPAAYPDLRPHPDFQIPNRLQRFLDYWWRGISIVHVVAKAPGELHDVTRPFPGVVLNLYQDFWVGKEHYRVWFPPDDLFQRAGLVRGGPAGGLGATVPKVFQTGEDIIKLRSVSGDHLFVDRMTYNFRRPLRGEIVVFETRHIKHWMVPTDQFYIKRLVGLSDESLFINTNRHLVVNGKELTASTPRFENLYGYNPTYIPNHYFGHEPTELFAGGATNKVPHDFYMVMGDNTRNSLDSRFWDGFPREDVIGKAWFVYWPIDSGSGDGGRFGWGYR